MIKFSPLRFVLTSKKMKTIYRISDGDQDFNFLVHQHAQPYLTRDNKIEEINVSIKSPEYFNATKNSSIAELDKIINKNPTKKEFVYAVSTWNDLEDMTNPNSEPTTIYFLKKEHTTWVNNYKAYRIMREYIPINSKHYKDAYIGCRIENLILECLNTPQ